MRITRSLVALLGAALALAMVSPVPAVAKSRGGHRTVKYDATESGSAVVRPGSAPGTLNETIDMDITGGLLGGGKIHLDNTVTVGAGSPWKASGTFTMTAQDGDVLRGTDVAAVTFGVPTISWVAFRRVTGGTGRFRGARGWLVSRGSATLVAGDPSTGTIRAVLSGDCKGRIRLRKRGWR